MIETNCQHCGQPTNSNDHICFVCWDQFRASGVVPEAQPATTSNGPGPKAGTNRAPDAHFTSAAVRYSESFADRIVKMAKKKDWIEYVNLCEQAAHIGRVALLESQADEMGIVTQ